MLEADITALVAAGPSAHRQAVRDAFEQRRAALVEPENAVAAAGARAVCVGKGREWGLSLATPVIVEYRDARTNTRTELEAWIR